MSQATQAIRCAIYTRAPGNAGRDASARQRSLCGAYIRRQCDRGWITLPEQYHDRECACQERSFPALQRLLEQVEHRQIDRLVIDRLSRICTTATDLDRLMLMLDNGGCALVAAGQRIDGATPVGRQVLVTICALAPAIDMRRSTPPQIDPDRQQALAALMRLRAVQGGQSRSRVRRTRGNPGQEAAS